MPRVTRETGHGRPTPVGRTRMAGCVLIGMASCVATPWSLEDAREAKRGDASNRGCCRRGRRARFHRRSRGRAAIPSSRSVTARAHRRNRSSPSSRRSPRRGSFATERWCTCKSGPYFVSAEIHLDSDAPHDKGDIATWATDDIKSTDAVPVGRRPRTRRVDVAARRRSPSPPTAPSSREHASGSTRARPRRRSSVSRTRLR